MSYTITHPDYNLIASVNNQYYSQDYLEYNLPFINELFLSKLPVGSNILDVCCGVGRLAQMLLSKGFKVTGIDSSEAMLHYARENASNGEFIFSDARDFELPPVFEGAISTGAFNHFMCYEELKSAFESVYKALRCNGLFVFNILLEQGFQAGWNDIVLSDAKDDCAWIVKHTYNPEEKIGQIKITGFRLIEGNWQRLDDIMLVKSYAADEVISALENVGFKQVRVHHSEPDKPRESYFVASK
ncbi:class I SAM-dependent methyltransferase [Chlorogloeopsis sp. ULAP02]|uniref:class I SAM-dependent DNA methyltransferase n=1 Tax=Chlorogloeopsis sp. ULAP02 TaxID=3107926 RepID=UPI0031374D01